MINLVKTYQEKYSVFECGYHSFLGQNRTQFGVKFFIFALVYLILDLEILLTFPYAASGYENGIYGLILTLGFIVIITLGFVFELGKQALRIDSKQTSSFNTRPSPKGGHLAAQAPASLNNKISNPSFLRKGGISPACVTKLTLGIRRFSSFSTTFLIDLDPPVGGGPPWAWGDLDRLKKAPGRVRGVAKRTRQSRCTFSFPTLGITPCEATHLLVGSGSARKTLLFKKSKANIRETNIL
jgi:NADH-ubiquinone oxidoreductase chain 3